MRVDKDFLTKIGVTKSELKWKKLHVWVDGWSQIISTYIVFLIETERILEKGEDIIANWETFSRRTNTWFLRPVHIVSIVFALLTAII